MSVPADPAAGERSRGAPLSSRISLPTYDVLVGAGVLREAGARIRLAAPAHRYVLITDDTVAAHHGAGVASMLGAEVLTVPAGESAKSRAAWSRLTDSMLDRGFGRDTVVIAMGGGVVGDLAGFVAATFMRGVPVVQVPTTLLAMIDASVGGKTGIDVPAGKNLVGAFHPPAVVLVDPDTLGTLPVVHFRAGMAEAIKHGLIADARYLDDAIGTSRKLGLADVGLRQGAFNLDFRGAELHALIARSIEIKAEVVRQDEREHGVRKMLNFGHTLGHAIEKVTEFGVSHGEAVAIGMALECELGERLGVTAVGTRARVQEALEAAGLPSVLPSGLDPSDVVAATRSDKKARAGLVEYVLLAEPGRCVDGWTRAVEDQVVLSVLRGAVGVSGTTVQSRVGSGTPFASVPSHISHKRTSMSSFTTYLIGFAIVILGLALAAYLVNVPPLWIMVGVLVMIGLGLVMATQRTRPPDPPKY
ncbi:MAG: 3-dehydroquinate synthase [Gemmatimonadetes bacterium]|nr:3-dehydroquinate synthase [Gemmatimonadota bacterium]